MIKRKKIIVCDIDGVLIDSSVRTSKYVSKALEDCDYNTWLGQFIEYGKTTEGDVIISNGLELFGSLCESFDPDEVRFITARDSGISAELTYEFLCKHVNTFPFSWLITKEEIKEIEPGIYWVEGSPKFDTVEFKRREILKLKQDYDIIIALDDRPDVCQMYWQEGIHAVLVSFPECNCQSLVEANVLCR